MAFEEFEKTEYCAKYLGTEISDRIAILALGKNSSMKPVTVHGKEKVYHDTHSGAAIKTCQGNYCKLEVYCNEEARKKVKENLVNKFGFKFKDGKKN